MAKFTFMVESEDAAEIAAFTAAISASQHGLEITNALGGAQPSDRQAEAAPKAARGRPKAEPKVPEPAAAPVEEIETVRGVSAADLLGDGPSPVEEVSFEQVRDAMVALLGRTRTDGQNPAEVARKIMDANGVSGRLGDAPKSTYPAVLAGFNAA